MDMSNAYDCLPHDLLIAKLEAYGIERKILKLIYSYLSGRKHRVKVASHYSSCKQIKIGVPQRSGLGPYVNLNWCHPTEYQAFERILSCKLWTNMHQINKRSSGPTTNLI